MIPACLCALSICPTRSAASAVVPISDTLHAIGVLYTERQHGPIPDGPREDTLAVR